MEQTRRTFLGTVGAVSLGAGVAGCLGNDDTPEPPVVGDPDADVTVTAYEDFACPPCRSYKLEVVPYLDANYIEPGLIRYEHRDFPVPADEHWSWAVASAAREVYETDGDESFWAFANEIYRHQGAYSYEAIEAVADELGFDGASVRQAADDGTHRSTIEDSKSHGESNGVERTPTVFVDGEQVGIGELGYAIDSALE